MNIESTMAGYYARRAQEYDRIFHKPERQDDLRADVALAGGRIDRQAREFIQAI